MSWVFNYITTAYDTIAQITFHLNCVTEWLYAFLYSVLKEEINDSDLLQY